MIRRLLIGLLACLASTGAAGAASADSAGASPAGGDGGIGIRLVDAPTDRADDPRALVYVVDHLHPQEVIERRIALTNSTREPVAVALYAAAADIDGGWRPREGRAGNDLTSWTTVTPRQVTIPPGGEQIASIRVAVPAGTPDGERYAVVWAEPPASDGAVKVVNRAGIRMYVSVGQGDEPATDFRIESVRTVRDEQGVRSLLVDVRNVGGRAIDLSGTAALREGPAGREAGPYRTGASTTLAPASAGTVRFGVSPDLEPGPWLADIDLRSGRVAKRASVRIRFPEEPGELTFPADGSVDPSNATVTPLSPSGASSGVTAEGADAAEAPPVGGDDGTSSLLAALLAALLLAAVGASAVAVRRRLRTDG